WAGRWGCTGPIREPASSRRSSGRSSSGPSREASGRDSPRASPRRRAGGKKGVDLMGLLEELRGGGQRRAAVKELLNRCDEGPAGEGHADQEVVERYKDVAHAVPPDQCAQAAQEALARLSPEERAPFVRMLQERAQARGAALPKQVGAEPRDLGQV